MPHTPAQKKALREARKAAGLCYFCPSPAMPGQVRCSTHSTAAAETRAFRKANGLCAKCTSASVPGKLHCAPCMEAGRLAAAKQRKERGSQGQCVQCGSPAKAGGTWCPSHASAAYGRARAATLRLRARTSEEVQADRDRLHPDGMKACRYTAAHSGPLVLSEFFFSRSRPDGLSERCRACAGRAYRRTAMTYWRSQGIPFVCVYCGGPFEHVDHVVPTTRGGTDDPTNLVPACTSCNTSKGDKLLAEWRA